MKKLVLLSVLAGCAPATYLYSFDLTDPGATNYKDFRRPDSLEDADVKAEIRLDPTEFKAIALDVTNKTEVPLQVQWSTVAVIAPDRSQRSVAPAQQIGEVEPGAKVTSLLVPFELPAVGPEAKAYDNTDFMVVVPMVVRGQPREYRYHLHVTLKKL